MPDSTYILYKQATKPTDIPAGAVGIWIDNSGNVRTVDEGGVENPVGPNTANDLATVGTPVDLTAGAEATAAGLVLASTAPNAAGMLDPRVALVSQEVVSKRGVQTTALVTAQIDEWLLVDPGTAGADQTVNLPDPAAAGYSGRVIAVQIDGAPGAFKATLTSPSGPLILGDIDLTVEGELIGVKSDGTSWRQVL